MTTRVKANVSSVLVLALSACATARPIAPLGGRTVELQPAGPRKGPAVRGELLAVGPERLWVLEPAGVRSVPFEEIDQARVRLHGLDGKKAGAWAVIGGLVTGVALTVACASEGHNGGCGKAFAIAAVPWALIGGPAAASLGRSSQLRVSRPELESLRPYARFPQGLPEGLDPTLLEKP
jgi:hypothetical protein